MRSSLAIALRFDESEHPRDEDGKSTDDGGGFTQQELQSDRKLGRFERDQEPPAAG
jgi:hypothetical protein